MTVQTLKCTFESEETCNAPAVRAFRWQWGKTGVTCAQHMGHLQTLADQLGRPIEFSDPFDVQGPPAAAAPPERTPRFTNVNTMAELDAALTTVLAEIRECWHSIEDLESSHARLSDQAANLKAQLASVQQNESGRARKPGPNVPAESVVEGSDNVLLEPSDDVDQAEQYGPETPVSGRNRVGGEGAAVADGMVETSRETPKKNGE